MKPICCGDRKDAEILLAASGGGLAIDEVNPIWFQPPAAPFTASLTERREVDPALLCLQLAALQKRFDFVAVEGVGGWLVPIRRDYFVSHLAVEMKLPVIVVAQNRLGCLNHILLTVQSVAAFGLECAGVVLNSMSNLSDVATQTNEDVLRRILNVPLLPNLSDSTSVLPEEWNSVVGPESAV